MVLRATGGAEGGRGRRKWSQKRSLRKRIRAARRGGWSRKSGRGFTLFLRRPSTRSSH